ncbi:MAG: hypothetical protein MRJ93_13180 [Nitrososphaeraceae archaeon]|nr:hypothetical protein [Nitrososphaeraceae archaeon]
MYTNGDTCYDEASDVIIGLKHYLYFSFQKILMIRVNQVIEYRIYIFESFPFDKEDVNLFHVHNWIQFEFLFILIQ